MEEIGKVKLDYSKYPGKDLYSDGAEEELLDIVRSKKAAEYAKVIEERKSWPILYHLSHLRENIIDWIPMEAIGKDAKVLEVGSGCGAITGALARKAGAVTCVELSKKRSLINACRHRECDNVTIHVGNFKDIEPDLPGDYDVICLIGVFEYARSYMGGHRPYEDFLKILMSHLSADGRILIAIENQYGLKYFAGCKEDHLGTYFSGIENYEAGGGARTFSRQGLERIFQSCGADEWHFYYPYPDYKFMTTLYSDEFLPKKGELTNNLRNFDRDRMLLFDEKAAFDGLVGDGLFPVFANSYLAVIGKGFDTKYVKYSNDRAPEYAIRTEIVSRLWYRQRLISIRKYPMGEEAEGHVRGMAAACESLTDRYRGSNLEINRCELVEEGDLVYAQFEFVPGVPLSELMDECLERDDLEGFYGYFREYLKRIGYNREYPAADFDLTFSNILVQRQEKLSAPPDEAGQPLAAQPGGSSALPDEAGQPLAAQPGGGSALPDEAGQPLAAQLTGGSASSYGASSSKEAFSSGGQGAGRNDFMSMDRWTLIDYEWTFGRSIDTEELAFRAVHCYLLEDAKRSKLKPELVLRELSITEEAAEDYRQQEREFQSFVTGERAAMCQIREQIGHKVLVPQKWIDKYQDSEQINRVQIYQDRGSGYSEKASYFVKDAYQGDGMIDLKLQVGGDVNMLRIDPSLCPCVVKIKEMTWNGEAVPLEKKKVLAANGRIVRPSEKGTGVYCPSIVFATEDPNINIALGGLARQAENVLRVVMEIVRLPLDLARDLADGKGR